MPKNLKKSCLYLIEIEIQRQGSQNIFIIPGKLDVPFEEHEAYLCLALQFELRHLTKLIKSRLEKAKTFGKYTNVFQVMITLWEQRLHVSVLSVHFIGASKWGFVRVTMISIDPAIEGKNLKEDFTKLAEVALPDPFRSQVGY